MTPLIPILIQQAPGLILDLIEVWKKNNPEVTLEEYLSALRPNLTYEQRRQAAALALNVPYVPLDAPVTNNLTGPRKPTAMDILDAITLGVAPPWFPKEAADVVARWTAKSAIP
jgi:hypothetical protein